MRSLVLVPLAALVALTAPTTHASVQGPDAGGYFWRDSHGPGVSQTAPAYTGPRTALTLTDESVLTVPLAQAMPFYGIAAATQVFLSDNGWLAFADPGTDPFPASTPIPSPALPDAIVAFAWDDLDPTGGVAEIGPIAGGQAIHLSETQKSSGAPVEVWIELYPNGRIKVDYAAAGDPASIAIGAEDGSGLAGTGLARGGIFAPGFTPGARYAFELLPPSKLGCPSATPLTCGSSVTLTTAGGPALVSSYGCSGATYNGAELILPVDVTATTSLTAVLTGFAPRAMTVLLLGTCHESSCVVAGTTASSPLLYPGRYYVVVDAPTAASNGAFTLDIACAPPTTFVQSGWVINDGEGVITFPVAFPSPGDPSEFDSAVVPPREDPAWVPSLPNRNVVDFSRTSILCGEICQAALDFTYLRTCLYVPVVPTSLVFTANGVDDGIAVRINGAQLATSGNGGFTSPNLAQDPALVAGAINEIQGILVDDCCSLFGIRNFQFRVDSASVPLTVPRICEAYAVLAPVGPPVCAGVPLTLDASGSSSPLCATPLEYRFREGTTELAPWSTRATLDVTPAAATTYTVDVRCPGGCGCEATTKLVLDPSRAIVTACPPSVLRCPGEAVSLGGTPTATGGTPPLRYLWSPAAGLDDPTSPNPLATPATSTTYTLTVTDSLGCAVTTTEDVGVSSLAHGVPPSVSICTGGRAVLGGRPTARGGIPPYSFAWSPVALVDNPALPNPTALGPGSQTYTLTLFDSVGCRIDASEDVLIAGGTPLTLGNSLLVARVGGDVTLSWGIDTNATDYSLKSDTAKAFTAPVVAANSSVPNVTLPGIVDPPPELVFYRVNGVGCAGEGP